VLAARKLVEKGIDGADLPVLAGHKFRLRRFRIQEMELPRRLTRSSRGSRDGTLTLSRFGGKYT